MVDNIENGIILDNECKSGIVSQEEYDWHLQDDIRKEQEIEEDCEVCNKNNNAEFIYKTCPFECNKINKI